MAVVKTSGNSVVRARGIEPTTAQRRTTGEAAVLALFPGAVVLSLRSTVGDGVEAQLLTLSGCAVVLALDAALRVTDRRTLAWHGPSPARTRMTVPARTAGPQACPWYVATHAA